MLHNLYINKCADATTAGLRGCQFGGPWLDLCSATESRDIKANPR